MTHTTNILFVLRNLDVGGMERLVIDLASDIHGDNYRVNVCTIEEDGQLAPILRERGIEVIALNKPYGLKPSTVLKLKSIIKSRNIHLIHTHNNTGHFYGSIANRLQLSKLPLIHTKHGRGDPSDKKSVLKNTLCSMLSDRIIAVSDDVADVCLNIENVAPKKISTIINCVDIEPYIEAAKNKTVNKNSAADIHFGHVGRLYDVKNQAMMLKAFAKVLAIVPTARLSLVGDGPLREELEKLSAELELQSTVTFWGYRADIPEIVSTFDCFLMSSLSEGTPLVLIEAMAAKCAVIGTDVGGMGEVVEEGKSGYLVPSKEIEALADKMILLAQNRDRLNEFANRGQQIAKERYGLSNMTNAYRAHYRELLEAN